MSRKEGTTKGAKEGAKEGIKEGTKEGIKEGTRGTPPCSTGAVCRPPPWL